MIGIAARSDESSLLPTTGALAPRPLKTFAEILSQHSSGAMQSPVSARGFDELGMFGLHAGRPMSEAPSRAMPQRAEPRVEGDAVRAAVQERAAPTPAMPVNVPTAAGSGAPATHATPSSDDAPNEVQRPFALLPMRSALPETEVCGLSAAREAAPLPTSRPRNPPRETLTAFADEDEVDIAARANVADADVATLRRRLDAAAAEFGMRLGSVRLNGAAAQPIHPIQGGRYGHHAG